MTIIAVSGGKGGTGKTTIAVNISLILSRVRGHKTLLVDLDVDNPCTYTLLGVSLREVVHVKSFKPEIDELKCTLCGECTRYCPTHALVLIADKLLLLNSLCEGCAACLYVCPTSAIKEGRKVIGWIKEAGKGVLDVIVGEAKPGERKTDDVMEKTLKYALKKLQPYDYVIIDTPPGTSRGIYEALKASDIIVLVTEPTRLGLTDLKRLYSLTRGIGRPIIVAVNKYGLKGGSYRELEDFLSREDLPSVFIPYDNSLLRSYIRGECVIEQQPQAPSAQSLLQLADKINEIEIKIKKKGLF